LRFQGNIEMSTLPFDFSLDVHVLLHNSNPDWLAQCQASIDEAVGNAGYLVNVRYLDGESGHIGRGRAKGYALGSGQYVTYVDNDDYLLPHAFCALAEPLSKNPTAIFPNEYTLQNGQLRLGASRHHLAIYRRDQIIDHALWRVCGDLAQVRAVPEKHVIEISKVLYVHRLYQSAGRILRRDHHDELRRARG
jgi:hypothetical protein